MEATNSTRISPIHVHVYKKEYDDKRNSVITQSNSEIKIESADPQLTTSETKSSKNCSSSGSLSEPQCRICFGGKEIGPLISACRCTGSIGFAHERCLLRWLQEKGTNRCEICSAPYQQTRSLRALRQWTFPDSVCRPNVYRGLFFTTVIWLCIYYFIIITIQPQNFVMKEVFFCVMYSLLMVLIIMTLAVFKNSCQTFAFSLRQWIALNSQAAFSEP